MTYKKEKTTYFDLLDEEKSPLENVHQIYKIIDHMARIDRAIDASIILKCLK